MGKSFRLDGDGREVLDRTPVVRRTSLRMPNPVLRMRNLVRQEMSRQALEQGQESFLEADDFGIPDEDPISPYEELFEPPVPVDSAPKVQESASAADAAGQAAKPEEGEGG